MTRWLTRLTPILILLACFVAGPLAAGPVFGGTCSSPQGNEADMFYNYSYHTAQFCNGTNWVPFAGSGYEQVSAGSGCVNPTGAEGAIIYNSTYHVPQFCNGTGWEAFGAASTPHAPNGYFVLSKSTWNGNLGGRSGADTLCLTELTTNTGWKGYSTASTEGLLVSGNVHAFLVCTQTPNECSILQPSTTYTFANANDSSAGGATFTTDNMGYGPADSANWSGSTYFNTTTPLYWTGASLGSAGTQWVYSNNSTTCTSWSSSSSGVTGSVGTANAINSQRWDNSTPVACNNSENLICYVNP